MPSQAAPPPRRNPGPPRLASGAGRATKSPQPAAPTIGVCAALLVAALMFRANGVFGGPVSNLVGFGVGAVLGFAALGWFAEADNRRQVPSRYRGGSSTRRFVCGAAVAAWALGIVHAYFLGLETTRHL